MENQFTLDFNEDTDIDHIIEIEDKVTQDLSEEIDHETINFTTPDEIVSILKNLNIKKAPGPDATTNAALKNLPTKQIAEITNITNACLTSSYFPKTWRHADIIPIHKPGKNPTFPVNYRPISLLSNFAKVIEKIINKRLNVHSEEVIQNEQFGFRDGHSAEHQIIRVIEYINDGFNTRRPTGATFLDINKAFNKVWHQGILYKMINSAFPLYLIKFIKSYLEDRTFCVKLNGHRSTRRPIESGVPQGSTIGPTLFNIYMSDFKLNYGSCTSFALYADDLMVFFKHRNPVTVTTNFETSH